MAGVAVFLVLFFIGVCWVAPVFASNAIGKSKGKENPWLWGLLLGWLGVLIVALQSRSQPPVIVSASYAAPAQALPAPAAGPTKQCPQCAEDVQAAARVCRFCGHRFEEGLEMPGAIATD
jgi:hypothetical protein